MKYLQNGKVELLPLKLISNFSDINPKDCTKNVASVYCAPCSPNLLFFCVILNTSESSANLKEKIRKLVVYIPIRSSKNVTKINPHK